ncbi:MAG TPA: tyrosine-type recombinase/integrase [Patescibacteria group bacterium]|nr:tyrosine-type recombinase/integrase [Patescibacteria group bacterium]
MEQIKFVSPDLIETFFRKIKSTRDKALFSAVYYYGLRASEVGLLTIEDIDMDNNRVFIHALKGGISGQHLLNPIVKRYIKSYLDQERLRLRTIQQALFLSQKGTPITSTQVYRLFHAYARKAKFPIDRRHPHVFRHSIAVHMAEGGFDVYQVKEHLRHKKIDNTLVYFQITNKTRMEKQREAFNSPMLARI